MRKLIDISRTISNRAVTYPGDMILNHNPLCEIDNESQCSITTLGNWSTHFLTHIDPPSHFIKGGKSISDIDINRFCGEVKIIEVDSDIIQPKHIINQNMKPGISIFFKTRNSDIATDAPFCKDHVYISDKAAEYMVECGINMVGIDYLSVDRFGDETYPAHYTLLKNDILIFEGILLEDVEPGNYYFYALPLKINDGDGSPVRAVLEKL